MEPCGGIITNRVLTPTVTLRPFLLTAGQLPSGYVTTGAQVTTGTDFVASVPSTVPVSYITFQLGTTPTAGNPRSPPDYSISEAIGEVTSSPLATQLAARIVQASEEPQCLGSGRSVPLMEPTTNLTAIENTGSTSAGAIARSTVVLSDGPYVINLAWTGQSSTPSEAPALPSGAEMESLIATALSHLPG
jgi:hypothetical protein